VIVGESILVRPYNWSGIISFIGATQFASGTWVGVTLDAPTGKRYFRYWHNIFYQIYIFFFNFLMQVSTTDLFKESVISIANPSMGSLLK
jgi:hypothetical protein